MLKFKRPHYAWFICLGGTLAIFISFGLFGNTFSFFVPDIIRERGFTNSQASLLTTIRTAFVLPSLFFINWLCDRLKPRLLITLGCLMVVAGYWGMSAFQTFWPCAACQALMGLGYSCAGVVPVAALFVRWFETNRTLAMGISSAASGAALLIAPPILTKLIAGYGLDRTFLFMSLACLVLTVFVFLLIRNTPEECSMVPYRHHAHQEDAARPEREIEPPPHTNAFHNFIIVFAVFLSSAPIGVGVNTVPVLLRNLQYEEMLVASVVSVVGLCMTVAKIVGAELYDLLGGRLGNYVIGGSLAAGLGLILLSPTHAVPIVFLGVVLFGCGIPFGSVSTYQWGADLYGNEGYAKAVQVFSIAYNVGYLIFSAVPGIMADRMDDNYLPSFIMFAVMSVVCVVLVQWLYHHLDIGKRPR